MKMYSLELEKEMSLEQIKESNISIISNKLIEHDIPKAENTNIFLKVNKEKKIKYRYFKERIC